MAGTKRRASSSKSKSSKKVESKSSSNKKQLSSKKAVLVKKVANEKEESAVNHIDEESHKLRKEDDKDDDDGDDQVPANNTIISTPVPTSTTTNTSGLVILDRMINEFNCDTWWMVDLHADPAPRQGATLLVRRCMKAYGWSETKARSVLRAYRQFLFIKKEKKDWNAEILSPSSSVDQMWHQHILDVVDYAHDCMLLCGFVVGHKPDGMYDEAGRQRRRNATREALLQHFGNRVDRLGSGEWAEIFFPNQVLESFPHEVFAQASNSTTSGGLNAGDDRLSLRVRSQDERTFFVNLKSSSTRMKHLIHFIAQKMGAAPDGIRLLHDGERILETDTPRKLGLRNHEQIDVVLPQCGC